VPWTTQNTGGIAGKSKRDYSREKPGRNAKFYNSKRWKVFRLWFLARHPLCADPHGNHKRVGVQAAATEVDHIIPLGTYTGSGVDPANAQALCKGCHSKKTGRERAGTHSDQT
jgi:5-methylcytosine-specific restriction protein A